MKIKLIGLILGTLTIVLSACNEQELEKLVEEKAHLSSETISLKSLVSLFEIPATNINRAIDFYQNILNITIEKVEMPEMKMGIFPYEEQVVTGVIIESDGYIPSATGVTIYLNGGDNLQNILDRVETNGGKIVLEKTAHADGNGYFALFIDSEGNRLGLNSPN